MVEVANRANGPVGGKWTKAEAARRAALGWELRLTGRTWTEVADEAGYQSASTACRAVTRFAGGLPEVDLDAMRSLAVERGEALWHEAWKDVLDDKPGCVTAAVRVLTRQAALLGLDQPTEVVLHTPTTAELERWVAGVLETRTPDVIEADVVGGEPIELEAPGPGELSAAP